MEGKCFIIDLAVYPMDIIVFIALSNEEVEAHLKEICIPEALPLLEKVINLHPLEHGHACHTDTGHYTVIRLTQYPDTPEHHGWLAHEVFHACTFLMWALGDKLRVNTNDESYAYLIDFVTQEIYENCK